MAGLAMYTPSKRRSMLAHRAAFALVGIAGARVLPGETHAWDPPFEPTTWSKLTQLWREQLGPFDDMAIHLRRPARRQGVSLLLTAAGTPVTFVKLRSERPERLAVECSVLNCLHDRTQQAAVPAVCATGEVDCWHYLALSPLPAKIHKLAADPPAVAIVDEYSHTLEAAWARQRPRDAGSDWLPMHGDFTPWNLRALSSGRLVLFDWEDAEWAPPRADLLWYDATIARKRFRTQPSGVVHSDEVVQFWIDRLSGVARPADGTLAGNILRQLRSGWRP